jgi:hypothetical protein
LFTHLHFYYFDIHTGNNPSAVIVAHANQTSDKNPKKSSLFGTDVTLTIIRDMSNTYPIE